MALLVIGPEQTRQLIKFELRCKSCGSDNVEIEIEWAAYPSSSWNTTSLICRDCHEEENLISD